MTRRVIALKTEGNRWVNIYSCYLKGCKTEEYKYRMCRKHFELLEKSFK